MIALAVSFWSLMTVACGLAHTFALSLHGTLRPEKFAELDARLRKDEAGSQGVIPLLTRIGRTYTVGTVLAEVL